MPNGKCALHGGKSLSGVDSPAFKHGRYSKHLPTQIKAKIDAFEDADPLDLLPELQIQRALLSEYIARFEGGIAVQQSDVYALVSWASDIGKMVERIVKMKNETALTAAEVALIAARIPDVVMRYIDDPDQQRRFVVDLFGAVGVSTRANQPQSLPAPE